MTSRKIQLVLDEDAVATLTTLQELTGARSMTEVIRSALAVYKSLHEFAHADERCLALVDREAGTMQELIILPFRREHVLAGERRSVARLDT